MEKSNYPYFTEALLSVIKPEESLEDVLKRLREDRGEKGYNTDGCLYQQINNKIASFVRTKQQTINKD